MVQRIGIESEKKHLKPVNVEIQLHVYQILRLWMFSKTTEDPVESTAHRSAFVNCCVACAEWEVDDGTNGGGGAPQSRASTVPPHLLVRAVIET